MAAYQPAMQHQGPATNCVIQGHQLGWFSCTTYAGAMAVDQATRGAKKVSGCEVRAAIDPIDVVGGTNLPQLQQAVKTFGVDAELRSGANVCTPAYAARRLMAGQAIALQGNTLPTLTTKFRSTGSQVNHCIMVSAVSGGTSDEPNLALVFDPAADGRRAGISSGPQWWPWALVKQFAAALRVYGEDDPRQLGPGKFYALIFPPTPPAPVVRSFTMHVAHNAVVRRYHLSGTCISSWTDSTWTNNNSKAPCNAPKHFKTCDGKSGAVTVLVRAGAFQGQRIRVGQGVTVTMD